MIKDWPNYQWLRTAQDRTAWRARCHWLCPSTIRNDEEPVQSTPLLSVRTNLFIPSLFWTNDMNFDNCCLHYIATCGENFI